MNSRYGFDDDWEIYLFDPNPYIDQTIALTLASSFGANCTFHTSAVWTEDASVLLQLQRCESKIGGSTALAPLRSSNRNLREGGSVMVKAIDFSRFIAGLQSERVIVRLDIEGAEFPVLRKMLSEGTITKVNDLHVEWHPRHFSEESRTTVAQLTQTLQERGVNVFKLG